jgi:hypothetical protein
MNVRNAYNIWIEQCEAAQTIKARFGLTAAFDYLAEGPATVAECVQQFVLVKELLTAPMLGTS